MLRRLWFYIKLIYIVFFAVLIFPAVRDVHLLLQGQTVDFTDWEFMLVSGIKYNWVIAVFAFSIEAFMTLLAGGFSRWMSDPEPKDNRRVVFPAPPEIVTGEVVEEMQTIAAHSYNPLQLGAGSLKWVSDNLEDLRNGGLWTPTIVDYTKCQHCGKSNWNRLTGNKDSSGNCTYTCKSCNREF